MERLTGLDADGQIISTEEYSIIGTRGLTDEENKNIVKHLLTKLYELENKEEELEDLTKLFNKTLEWDCNDMAKTLYANAAYAVISGNEIYKECIDEFKYYMMEKLFEYER